MEQQTREKLVGVLVTLYLSADVWMGANEYAEKHGGTPKEALYGALDEAFSFPGTWLKDDAQQAAHQAEKEATNAE